MRKICMESGVPASAELLSQCMHKDALEECVRKDATSVGLMSVSK